MGFQFTSSVFSDHGAIPKKYSGQGDNISPPLTWAGAPAETKSFAMIVDDPDAPIGTFVHWVIFNIPPSAGNLPEDVPKLKNLTDGSLQGRNTFQKIGYGGPLPPTQKPHRYFFKLHALDTMLGLEAGAYKKDLLKAMEGHILAEAELVGVYQKQ